MILAGYGALRLLLLLVIPVNSDEPQHLHVAWAWSQPGMAPYLDVFDNHMPLFHRLTAWLLALRPDDADIIVWARMLVLPMALLAVLCGALLARRLWGSSAAVCGIILLPLFPHYFTVAGQFRADAAWALAWIGMLALLVVPRPGWRWRTPLSGIMLGIAFALSLKTLVLLAGLALAALVVVMGLPVGQRPSWRVACRFVLVMLGCAATPITLVLGVVALRGGLPAMHYAVISHNLAATGEHPHGGVATIVRTAALAMMLFAAICAIRRVLRSGGQSR